MKPIDAKIGFDLKSPILITQNTKGRRACLIFVFDLTSALQ